MVRNIIFWKSELKMSALKSLAGLVLRSSSDVMCLSLFALTVPTWSKLAFEHGCVVYFQPFFSIYMCVFHISCNLMKAVS